MESLILLAVRQPAKARKRKVVVLVDDDPPTLRALLRALRDEPYTVLGTSDPQQALKWIGEREVHVVLSDQRMPGMQGTELLARVREESPRTTCAILTGYADLPEVTEALGRGVREVIAKPWDHETLRDKIRGWLEA